MKIRHVSQIIEPLVGLQFALSLEEAARHLEGAPSLGKLSGGYTEYQLFATLLCFGRLRGFENQDPNTG